MDVSCDFVNDFENDFENDSDSPFEVDLQSFLLRLVRSSKNFEESNFQLDLQRFLLKFSRSLTGDYPFVFIFLIL